MGGLLLDLRTSLYDHLQGLSLRFFHRQRLGDLLTCLTGDIAAIEDLLVSGIADLVAHSLTIVLFLGMLFYLDAALALVSLAVLPVLAVSRWRTHNGRPRHKLRSASRPVR
ncbi:MAG: hypothetical protein LC797_09380 [Chloroflexi bacterium]|nr:hypothetical protein [Chloroflexota bacterium]